MGRAHCQLTDSSWPVQANRELLHQARGAHQHRQQLPDGCAVCRAEQLIMPQDRVTNKHQSYAFVEFKGEDDANYVRPHSRSAGTICWYICWYTDTSITGCVLEYNVGIFASGQVCISKLDAHLTRVKAH